MEESKQENAVLLLTFSLLKHKKIGKTLLQSSKSKVIGSLKTVVSPKKKAKRFYIASLKATPSEFCSIIRSHWSIENKLHWCLDVSFGEDNDRKRTVNASQNFSTLNKIALNILKNEKTLKVGIKGRRLKAGWDNNYLKKLMNF